MEYAYLHYLTVNLPNVKENLSSILTCGVSFIWSLILLFGSPVTASRHFLRALQIIYRDGFILRIKVKFAGILSYKLLDNWHFKSYLSGTAFPAFNIFFRVSSIFCPVT